MTCCLLKRQITNESYKREDNDAVGVVRKNICGEHVCERTIKPFHHAVRLRVVDIVLRCTVAHSCRTLARSVDRKFVP